MRPAVYAALAVGKSSAFSEIGTVLLPLLQHQGSAAHADFINQLRIARSHTLGNICVWAVRKKLETTGAPEERLELLNELCVFCYHIGNFHEGVAISGETLELAWSMLNAIDERSSAEKTSADIALHKQLARMLPTLYDQRANGLFHLNDVCSELESRHEALARLEKLNDDHGMAFEFEWAVVESNYGNALTDARFFEQALASLSNAYDRLQRLKASDGDNDLPTLEMKLLHKFSRYYSPGG